MEATAYAELKSNRDAARKTVTRLRDTLRSLKYAAENMTKLGDDVQAANITDIREALKPKYGEAITSKEALEAEVTEARKAYKAEHFNAEEENAGADDPYGYDEE